MLEIDEAILLNQLAQDIVAVSDGQAWFDALDDKEKRRVLNGLVYLVLQAGPRQSDAAAAVSRSGFSRTLTPCVVIAKPGLKAQLAKIPQLAERELQRSFRLLIILLSIADGRRRAEKPLDLVNHWWHRDLSDPDVVKDIKRTFG